MIRWESGMAWPKSGEANGVPDSSVIIRLAELAEALSELDATDPETDSVSFDRATDQLISAVRHAVTAARPILEHPCALEGAVREAITDRRDRRDLLGWCRDCDRAGSGRCGDHAENLALADLYETLLPAVTYPRQPVPPAR